MKYSMEMRRLVVLSVTLSLAVMVSSGCTGRDGQAGDGQDTAAGQSETAANTKPSPMPAQGRVLVSPDLANYPMPATLPGQDRVPGPIVNKPRDWGGGESGDLLVASVNDTLVVTVFAMRINCCTERLAAAVKTTDLGVEVMLYEYLPDVCECFHQRDITFRLFPAPTAGQRLSVKANGRQEILADKVVP